MNEYRRNVLVGLFLIAGLAGLLWLSIMFGEVATWLFGGRTYRVDAFFDNVSNIIKGDEIHMKGVRVGHVEDVGFRDPSHPEKGVRIEMAIMNKWRIPRSAYVRVELQAMSFARSFVKIIVPPGEVDGFLPQDGTAALQGETISAFDSMFPPDVVNTLQKATGQIGDLAEALTPVAEDLHQLLKPTDLELLDNPKAGAERISANLYTAAQRLDSALKHFNDVLGDPNTKSSIRITVENLREMSEKGKAVMEDFKAVAKRARFVAEDTQAIAGKVNKLVDKANGQLDDITRAIVTDAEKLGRFFDQLNVAGEKLAKGEGTAGKFLSDPELYESMVLTMKRLQLAVEDMSGLIKEWKREGLNVKGVGMFK